MYKICSKMERNDEIMFKKNKRKINHSLKKKEKKVIKYNCGFNT